MARQIFTWSPDMGAQRSVKANVMQTKFGDGYEQRVAKGINTMPKSWQVTFSRVATVASDILAFLEARGGREAFDWVDPMDVTGTYVCREWRSTQQTRGVYVVTATFEQVFEY